jgi:hypothetical protein
MANKPTYDKYEPLAGGFRAHLNAALTLVAGSFFGGVSLNASGLVVVGTGGQSGLVGVLVKNVAKGPVGAWGTDLQGGTPNAYAPIGAQAGDQVDIMTDGEIVGLDPAVFVAGTLVYTTPAGVITVAATAGNFLIGHTVEAGRLRVRVVLGTLATE